MTRDKLYDIRRVQKMDLGGASRTTGRQPAHNEQTVKYMSRLSQEVHLDTLQLFIHKIWNHNAVSQGCKL